VKEHLHVTTHVKNIRHLEINAFHHLAIGVAMNPPHVMIDTAEAENVMKNVVDRKNANIPDQRMSDDAQDLEKNVAQDPVNVTIITRKIATKKILKMISRVTPSTKRRAKSPSK
jgi:hypothetical protein